ncbi:MAG: hypothetical protein WD267_10430 [Balneolales bacterium]
MRNALFIVVFILLYCTTATARDSTNTTSSELIENFSMTDLFDNEQVYTIASDNRGITYFGISNGIIEFDGVEWRVIEVPNNQAITALEVDNSGRIYAAGEGEFGYLIVDDLGNTDYMSLSETLSIDKNERILDISIHNETVYFIGYHHIYRQKNRELRQLEVSGAFYTATIFKDKLFLIDQNQGLVYLNKHEQLIQIKGGKTLRSNTMLSLNDKNMLIITSSKVYELSHDIDDDQYIVQLWENDNPTFFTLNQISGISKANGDVLAFSTHNAGILLMNTDGQTLNHITSSDGLYNDVVYDTRFTRRNNMWIGLSNAVAILRTPLIIPELAVVEASVPLHNSQDTLIIDDEKSIWSKITDWLAGFNPFSKEPQSIDQNKKEELDFATIVRRVEYTHNDSLIFGGAFTHETFGVQTFRQADTAKYVFPHTMNAFRFSYATNYYEQLDKIQYQVLLEGLDQTWLPWTPNTYREYTNLGWGKYNFKVRAQNAQGEISETATFSFNIKPPWYEAVWFYMLQLGTLLGCIVVSYYLNKSGKALGFSEVLISIVVVITFKYLNLYIMPLLQGFSQGIAVFQIGISIIIGLSLRPAEKGFRWTLDALTLLNSVKEPPAEPDSKISEEKKKETVLEK